ncbi:MAG TPA: type VII secretion protein EccE [Nocardia sp.]|uniref:type VII secretion protein EccE n=1 Tax=Nocardia sp. TaxID=1821 RepID=UPI002B4B6D7C|nr:type VII secretion protein EccE [Nocardia sp.]HLS76887.1 type VII secretion protein EccE [Nocardia sp.]
MASTTAGSAADAPVHPLRSPQFWFFRTFPLRRVLAVLAVANAIAVTALIFDAPPAAAAGGAAALFVLLLVPVRGTSAAGWLAAKAAFVRQRFGRRPIPAGDAPFDVPLPDGGSYGMRWDGRHVITVLRLDAPPPFVTRLSPSGLSTGDKVPLPELARCLNQFDIELAAIDVISTGARTAAVGAVARLYDQILGPLPAVAHRTVWVVLRLDPLANAAAANRRGGGSTGVLRTVIVATQRVANRLAARGLTASVLSSAELNAMVHQLTHGVDLAAFTESPDALEHDGLRTTTFRAELDALGPRGFADMWTTSTIATTVTMRLRRAPEEPGRAPDPGDGARIDVSALVRFTTRKDAQLPDRPGLIALPGRQFRALVHTLPIGTAESGLPEESVIGDADALTELTTPIAGCGQLIGADDSGQGVAMPLVAAHVRRVEVTGGVLVAKQVILRAIAVGATVVVHTTRHDAWRTMVDRVGSPALTLAAWSAGSQQANSHRSANVVVYDGVPVTGHHSDTTVIVVREHGAAPSGGFEPDITLTESEHTANVVTIRSAAGAATVRMVATPFEIAYLGIAEPSAEQARLQPA